MSSPGQNSVFARKSGHLYPWWSNFKKISPIVFPLPLAGQDSSEPERKVHHEGELFVNIVFDDDTITNDDEAATLVPSLWQGIRVSHTLKLQGEGVIRRDLIN